jgi:putative glutamine amidotransferase
VRGVPTSYVDAVALAGGRPMILPPGHAVELLDLVDGVVLAGGDNVGDDPDRDDAEFALVRAAREAGTPMLGVCRGLQVLTVADGGSLIADLGEHQPHVRPEIGHPATTTPGSLTAALLGNYPTVSSLHRQAADRLGDGWSATARAEDDVIEAAEWVGNEWPALGVQWHPELDATGPALFRWLVERAAAGARNFV